MAKIYDWILEFTDLITSFKKCINKFSAITGGNQGLLKGWVLFLNNITKKY